VRNWIDEVRAEALNPGLLVLDVDEIGFRVVIDDVHDRSLPLYLGQEISEPQHGEAPVTQSAIVWRPGKATCAPKAFGEALAI
jgi:hypothetical protein